MLSFASNLNDEQGVAGFSRFAVVLHVFSPNHRVASFEARIPLGDLTDRTH